MTFVDYSVPNAIYQLGLIDFPFDMNGEDTRFFPSQEEQQSYFENAVTSGTTPWVNIEAPAMDSLYITKQVYQGSKSSVLNQFGYVNKNYAVIKVTAPKQSPQYFYYWIEKSTIGSGGKMFLDLRMDTVQTYFFNPSITIPACMIERAHLNRFEDDPTQEGYVRFNRSDTRLFNAEQGFDTPKRLVSRTKLDLNFTGNAAVDNWLNENVAYWVYIFIDPTHIYSVWGLDSNNSATLFPGGAAGIGYSNRFHSAVSVICYPEYKVPGHEIQAILTRDDSTTITVNINKTARYDFEKLNNDTSYYYMIKISIVPPSDVWQDSYISGKNLILTGSVSSINSDDIKDEEGKPMSVHDNYGLLGGSDVIAVTKSSNPVGIFVGAHQESTSIETENYVLLENSSVLKTAVARQQPPQLSYNPKLNGQNFRELVITSANGDEFSYDVQKLEEGSISFLYSEPIQPEVTKYYMRVNAPAGLYLEGTEENYTGLVGSADNGVAFTNDQYAAFLANNKNFYLQSNMKIVMGAVKSTAGIVAQGVSGNVAGAAGSAVGTIINTAESLIDRSLTVDNMRNAPDQLKNANGNVIFNMFAMDLGIYLEKYVALDSALKSANDFMDLYGFSVAVVDDISNYTNIRKYHNYVKAQVQAIVGNISNEARNDLRRRFADGIRFWNGDTISYEYENYENWLEE